MPYLPFSVDDQETFPSGSRHSRIPNRAVLLMETSWYLCYYLKVTLSEIEG